MGFFIYLYLLFIPLATVIRAQETNGITLFYAKNPTREQMAAFRSGNFSDWPPSLYECANDVDNLAIERNFSCSSTAHNRTPETIRDYGTPMPPCTEFGVVFELLKWGTWVHKCWSLPTNPSNTEEGHREAAFQSNAIDARRIVLYQHGAHVYTINKAIEALHAGKEEGIHVLVTERDAKLAEIDAWETEEKDKVSPKDAIGWIKKLQVKEKAKNRRKVVRGEAEAKIVSREKQFWTDSFAHRMAVAELDRLVPAYFELRMLRRAAECLDWAGYGVPDPEFPPN